MNAPIPDITAVVEATSFADAVTQTHSLLARSPRRIRLVHVPSGDRLMDAAHGAAIHGFGRSLRIELRGTVDVSMAPARFVAPSAPAAPRKTPEARRCVITGAASGIGRAMALEFARGGWIVNGVDIDADATARTLTELHEIGSPASLRLADLRTLESLPCTPEHPADLVIHNAGISQVGPFAAAPLDEALTVVALNLDTPIRLTNALLAGGGLAPGGSVVFVSSLSHFVGYPGASVYAGTKDGLAAYAEALRSTRPRDELSVLTVFPGPVRTDHARRYSPDNSAENRRMDPADVARMTRLALAAGRDQLVPGASNQLMTWIGRRFPGVAEGLMERAVYRRLSAATQ